MTIVPVTSEEDERARTEAARRGGVWRTWQAEEEIGESSRRRIASRNPLGPPPDARFFVFLNLFVSLGRP